MSQVKMDLADALLLVERSIEMGKYDNAIAVLRDLRLQLAEARLAAEPGPGTLPTGGAAT